MPTTTEQTVVLTTGASRIRRFRPLHPTQVSTIAELRQALSSADKNTLWISCIPRLGNALPAAIRQFEASHGDAVFLHPVSTSSIPVLGKVFGHGVFDPESYLSDEELVAVLISENRSDLFIAGRVDPLSKTVALWRGNRRLLIVPFSGFPTSGDGTKPDFSDFAVTDCGQTIRFGSYEAATDAILYEFAPDYRRTIKKQRLASEQSFGASLRRLRKQRGLRREDFAPLTAKTITRIEHNKVKHARGKTLSVIAERLGVQPSEIENY